MRFPNSRTSCPEARTVRRVSIALAAVALLAAGAADARELFSIRVENDAGGRVQVRLAGGEPWSTIGSVTRPASATVPAFPAASFVPPGTVAATAVHGIRIRVPSAGLDPISISLQPADFQKLPDGYGGHIPGRSAIITDIPAGRGIFRDFAPLVGDDVMLESGGSLSQLRPDWRPSPGDVIVILCSEPDPLPLSIEFENRRGGSVSVREAGGAVRTIGEVRQPVTGVGRFDGTSYTGTGAINTNHGGVITVSTAPESRPADEGAPPERRGGFEIQPYQHALTQPDMTQAMIVAPLDSAGSLEGAAPLFRGALPLGDGSNVVDIRLGGGEWTPLPAMTGKIDDAFTPRGLARLGLAPAGSPGATAFRIRMGKRDPAQLAQELARIALPSPTPGQPMRAVWALKMPYADGAATAIFSRDGKTVAISNVRPYEVQVEVSEPVTSLRADIVSGDGRTLETRAAVVRITNGKLTLSEKPSATP